jgi:hypothetical protein
MAIIPEFKFKSVFENSRESVWNLKDSCFQNKDNLESLKINQLNIPKRKETSNEVTTITYTFRNNN